MNKKLLLIVMLITLSSMMITPSPVLADDVSYSGTVLIEPETCYYFGGGDGLNDGLYGTFNITEGTAITFFILNQYNFQLFRSGVEDVEKMHIMINRTHGDIAFRIPTSGIYYYMFDNRADNITTQHLTYEMLKDMTGPEITTNLVNESVRSMTVTIDANATDINFGVLSMSLYINTVLLYTVQDSTLTYNWDTTTYPDAFHTITIRAVDDVRNDFGELGNIAELVFTIAIDNIDPTTPTTTTPTTTTDTPNTTIITTDASGNPVLPGSNYTFYQYESLLITNLLLTAILGILLAPTINKHRPAAQKTLQPLIMKVKEFKIRPKKEPEPEEKSE